MLCFPSQMQIYLYNSDDFDSLSAAIKERRIVSAMAVFFEVKYHTGLKVKTNVIWGKPHYMNAPTQHRHCIHASVSPCTLVHTEISQQLLDGWITLRIGADSHIPLRMNCNHFDDPLTFHVGSKKGKNISICSVCSEQKPANRAYLSWNMEKCLVWTDVFSRLGFNWNYLFEDGLICKKIWNLFYKVAHVHQKLLFEIKQLHRHICSSHGV